MTPIDKGTTEDQGPELVEPEGEADKNQRNDDEAAANAFVGSETERPQTLQEYIESKSEKFISINELHARSRQIWDRLREMERNIFSSGGSSIVGQHIADLERLVATDEHLGTAQDLLSTDGEAVVVATGRGSGREIFYTRGGILYKVYLSPSDPGLGEKKQVPGRDGGTYEKTEWRDGVDEAIDSVCRNMGLTVNKGIPSRLLHKVSDALRTLEK